MSYSSIESKSNEDVSAKSNLDLLPQTPQKMHTEGSWKDKRRGRKRPRANDVEDEGMYSNGLLLVPISLVYMCYPSIHVESKSSPSDEDVSNLDLLLQTIEKMDNARGDDTSTSDGKD